MNNMNNESHFGDITPEENPSARSNITPEENLFTQSNINHERTPYRPSIQLAKNVIQYLNDCKDKAINGLLITNKEARSIASSWIGFFIHAKKLGYFESAMTSGDQYSPTHHYKWTEIKSSFDIEDFIKITENKAKRRVEINYESNYKSNNKTEFKNESSSKPKYMRRKNLVRNYGLSSFDPIKKQLKHMNHPFLQHSQYLTKEEVEAIYSALGNPNVCKCESSNEIAREVGINPHRLREWLRKGSFNFYNIKQKRWYFPNEIVEIRNINSKSKSQLKLDFDQKTENDFISINGIHHIKYYINKKSERWIEIYSENHQHLNCCIDSQINSGDQLMKQLNIINFGGISFNPKIDVILHDAYIINKDVKYRKNKEIRSFLVDKELCHEVQEESSQSVATPLSTAPRISDLANQIVAIKKQDSPIWYFICSEVYKEYGLKKFKTKILGDAYSSMQTYLKKVGILKQQCLGYVSFTKSPSIEECKVAYDMCSHKQKTYRNRTKICSIKKQDSPIWYSTCSEAYKEYGLKKFKTKILRKVYRNMPTYLKKVGVLKQQGLSFVSFAKSPSIEECKAAHDMYLQYLREQKSYRNRTKIRPTKNQEDILSKLNFMKKTVNINVTDKVKLIELQEKLGLSSEAKTFSYLISNFETLKEVKRIENNIKKYISEKEHEEKSVLTQTEYLLYDKYKNEIDMSLREFKKEFC